MWAIGNNMKDDAWEFVNKISKHLTFEAYTINSSNKCKGDTWELWEQHKEQIWKNGRMASLVTLIAYEGMMVYFWTYQRVTLLVIINVFMNA
jgi:hypothetical protein